MKCLLPPTIDKPSLSPAESITFKEHMSHHIRSARVEWAYVIGQYTKELIVKLETYDTYTQVNASNDVIAILNMIQQVCFNYQNDEMPIVSKFCAFMLLFSMKQQRNESITDFSKRFTEQIKVMEACNGSLVNDGVRNYIAHKKYGGNDYSTLY